MMPGARSLLALTRGDPAGIGPELALKAWSATRFDPEAPAFFIIADPGHLAALAKRFGLEIPLAPTSPEEAAAVFPEALPIVSLKDAVKGTLGRPDPGDAAATIRSIEAAVDFVKSGRADAVVTNPISKEVLQRAGFAHPGHTEFLGELADRLHGKAAPPVMLLWSPWLAVVPATIHVPLRDVPPLITRDLLIDTALIVDADFRRRFGIAAPRLAFAGLNPHAGEGGHMGREEIDVIAPAIADLRARGIDACGPYSADTLFHAAAREKYDVAICMYHDQALIPIKTVAFDNAVNVTLGLPFIRTSPDHGTAFDIAAQGIADPTSLIAALRLAAKLANTNT
jgi:4-hydroxythreonine-4-phosphate dehydrogenase